MAVLLLAQGADNKILRTASAEVTKIDRKIKDLIRDMIDTMIHAEGIGIAAPQVGMNLRLFIARLNHGTVHETIIPMINPEILEKSEEIEAGEEGCLSLPKRFGVVPRTRNLTVRFTDMKGQKRTLHLEDLNARIIQHEADHIDGHLFIDRMEHELTLEELEEKRLKKSRWSHNG